MCEGISCTTPLQMTQMLTALVTAAVAVIVALITFQQWMTNRATVREKLFDRRFEVFKETQRVLTTISERLSFDQSGLHRYTDAFQRSRFLFDPQLSDYLKEIRDRALDLELASTLMNDPNEVQNRIQHVNSRHDNGVWLNKQLDTIFPQFHRYLDFSKVT